MLGRGAANCLVRDGWDVVVADIDLDEAEKVAAERGAEAKVEAGMVEVKGVVATVEGVVDALIAAAHAYARCLPPPFLLGGGLLATGGASSGLVPGPSEVAALVLVRVMW